MLTGREKNVNTSRVLTRAGFAAALLATWTPRLSIFPAKMPIVFIQCTCTCGCALSISIEHAQHMTSWPAVLPSHLEMGPVGEAVCSTSYSKFYHPVSPAPEDVLHAENPFSLGGPVHLHAPSSPTTEEAGTPSFSSSLSASPLRCQERESLSGGSTEEHNIGAKVRRQFPRRCLVLANAPTHRLTESDAVLLKCDLRMKDLIPK